MARPRCPAQPSGRGEARGRTLRGVAATPQNWPCHASMRGVRGKVAADRWVRRSQWPHPVANPRRIVPGETYLITRRCYQRTFRLRPCVQTNQIFLYCLAFAAERTGVVVHATCVMSNHHHMVVTDMHGVLPNFLRELHRLTAKAMNASQGQWENLWAAEPCNVVRLVTDQDIEDKSRTSQPILWPRDW